MTADKQSRLVPKLRFPEFKDDATWLAPQLADLYRFKPTNTLSRDKLNYEFGTIRNIHYGDIHTKFKPLFRLENEYVPYVNPDAAPNGFNDDAFCKEGDIILADASEDLDDVGKAIEVVSIDGERVVAGTHTILATRQGSIPVVGFGGHLFQSAAVRTGIKKEAQGAKVYGISANRISAIRVPVPPTEAEQQKIADCLGSLDDLIVAEGRKLEALRRHKQGLMQQLFPQPGETVPRLRFPEFRNDGEWEAKHLEQVAPLQRGFDLPASELEPGDVPVVYSNGIGKYHSIGRTVGPGLVTGRSGTIGQLHYIASGDYWPHNTALWVTTFYGNYPKFVYYLYEAIGLKQFASGSGVPTLNRNDVHAYEARIPSRIEEQQRIASCLTSLDDQIAAQAKKIEALKQHKQGLLQQLFPSLEGNE